MAGITAESINKTLGEIKTSTDKTTKAVETLSEDQKKTTEAVEQLEKNHNELAQKVATLPTVTPGSGQQRDTMGFKSFGEFAQEVQRGSAPGAKPDERLVITKAPNGTTVANESFGDAGGYLVPDEWSSQVWQIVFAEESILSRTQNVPTSRNALSLPTSTATPWGNTGVQAYWTDEAAAITQSRPTFDWRSLRLHKIAALVPASEELLEDATALSAFIGPEAAKSIRYKVDDAIINGNGVGKPMGILSSAALVAVDKDAGQAGSTLLAANIAKMYARMPASSINKAVWLMNQDVLPQLLTMTLGNVPIYLPPNGMADAPFGTLFGRPIILSQHSQTQGNQGDILFVDLSQYLTLTKAGGIKSDTSIHLWFDYDITAFRFTFRVAGKPWIDAPITPDNSADPLSPFVALKPREDE